VLAPGGDDDVLLAAGDVEETLGVELAEVSRMQPAIDEGLGGRFGVVEITGADVLAAHPKRTGPCYPDLGTGERWTDAAKLGARDEVEGGGAGILALSVDLVDDHIEACEEFQNLFGDGCRAADAELGPAKAQGRLELGQNQFVGQLVF